MTELQNDRMTDRQDKNNMPPPPLFDLGSIIKIDKEPFSVMRLNKNNN